MRTIVSRKFFSILLLSLTCLLPGKSAQAQAGACGPYCADTNDFVATVTSFRTSTTTSNVKIIDATIRFQNKTSQPLILGYAISSGMATDDQGNRLVVGGPNGYRGIGYVNGSNFDPRFAIKPGGYADAQFELLAQGWPKIVGFTHQLDLTVSEINSYEGNQHTVGSEFPLHFQGLKNGSAGTVASLGALTNAAAGAGPCGLAAAQGAAGQASATLSNAASAISSFGSLFHKKKAAQNANQVASAAAGCDPNVNNAASAAGGLAGLATAASAQQAQATTATAQAQQMMGAPGTAQQIAPNASLQSAVQSATASSQASAQLGSAAAQSQLTQQIAANTATNPGNVAATAFSKMKLWGMKHQQNSNQPPPQQVAAAQPSPAAPVGEQQQSSSPHPNLSGANMQGAQLEDQANPDVTATAPTKAVSAGKYDIIGIHLGMPGKEAAAILRSHGLQMSPETIKYDVVPQPLVYGVKAINKVLVSHSGAQPGAEMVYIMLTMPPNQQVVSKVSRFLMFTKDTAPTSDSLVADLVKKYGNPSYDSHPANLYYSGYRELYWVDDAQGHRLNVTLPNGVYNAKVNNCRSMPTFSPSATSYPTDYDVAVDPTRVKFRLEKGFSENFAPAVMADCASMTMIYARIIYGYPIGITTPDLAGGLVVVVGSGPLDRMATEATRNYLIEAVKNRDAQRRQAAQKNKPAL